ncbi:MAG: DUF302 domain-containing protein [Gammaproteobacteria bacterium]|nr:DUF302 domain-containing protein [Gammaproteobacteria bacterium]
MKNRVWILTAMVLVAVGARAQDDGLVNVRSQHDVATTVERLVEIVKKKGLKHFTTIDHAAGAKSVGATLAPTQLVLFGNPKIGTPLMNCGRTAAIDLPQKALIWQAADGAVWVTYNDPAYLNSRHQLGDCEKVLMKVTGALKGLTAYAAGAK